MHVRAADIVYADKPPATIDIGVQLVTVVGAAVLARPARIHVFLRALGIAPLVRNLILFDARVFLARVALDWCTDDAGIDDLPTTGNTTTRPSPSSATRWAGACSSATRPILLRVAAPDSEATWRPWPQWRGIACGASRQCAGQAGSLPVSAAQIFLRHSRPAIVLASGH